MNCSSIIKGLTATSCNPTTGGTLAQVYLINFDDIEDITYDNTDSDIITGITLKSGKKGYLYESADDTTVGTIKFNGGKFINTFGHQVDLSVLVKNENSKDFINGLTNASVVAILANKERGELYAEDSQDNDVLVSSTKFEVYGSTSGMKMSGLTATTEVADGIVYKATLSTKDGNIEKSLPKTFWKTSYSTTEAALVALLA